MTDREIMQQALDALEESVDLVRHEYSIDWRHGLPTRKAQLEDMKAGLNAHEAAITALRTALEQQAEPPPEWLLIKNILDEYGLDAIAFVAEWKAAQRPWVGLTPEEVLDLFDRNNVYGSKWIEFARTVEAKLRSKNDY